MKSTPAFALLTLVVAASTLTVSASALAETGDNGTSDNPGVVSTRSRADVQAEAERAVRDGTTRVNIDTGEAIPSLLSPRSGGKTRAQVKAETLEARRLGLIGHGWRDNDPLIPTEAQLRQVAQAGERANAVHVSAR